MNTQSFQFRHIGPKESEIGKMLSFLESHTLDDLISQTVPDNIRADKSLDLPNAMSEFEYLQHVQELSKKNKLYKTYIGLGYHPTVMPSAIQRNILENPSWYTAYTPYQAEISQGRLEALLNFQTMITDLTKMELANASLLDEGTAAAEAMSMFFSTRKKEKEKNNACRFFVSEEVFPQTISILKTRSQAIGIELVIDKVENIKLDDSFFGCLLQYPGKSGEITDYTTLVSSAKELDIKICVAADIMSLILLEAPGSWGADAVVGSTQRFGIPLGYGGPHAAFFATKQEYKRAIPGRIIGLTRDPDGKQALRMALQVREQHIKREKATSNICTSQVLLAVMAGMYAVYHGPEGLKEIAHRIHALTKSLFQGLKNLGIKQINKTFFDTITIRSLEQDQIDKLKELALQAGINFFYRGEKVSISINETTCEKSIKEILSLFSQIVGDQSKVDSYEAGIPQWIKRKTSFLEFDVFNSYQSETELMRYIKSLERKDLSLTHSMISLGSCTMKLNAASELLPLSWASWGNIHPFVPKDQAKGYYEMFEGLEAYLSEITGFEATSLQPNSGAQGEFAGLMVIRAYHKSRGDHNRNIVLIPSSAHGTNPASANMAGMKVVVVKTLDNGNIDIEDLKEKAEKYRESLSALMMTYPSTYGVFEDGVCRVTEIIHENGGQVYMDGANMNAQIGLTSPGLIGADVCHLNLHKTFAIPHGGGGPGMGPICCAKHLEPFLPTNPVVAIGGDQAIPSISAAPYGSALILLISYGYIRMLGPDGLKKCSEIAILNANYLKQSLEDKFKILYTGENDRVAHELILDCRPFKQFGIDVIDIAKRLMDYGFHAPTVSFPVAGTIMIEPTESENKAEMDRFAQSMNQIFEEVQSIVDRDNNIVKNAPHTLEMLTTDQWNLPYSRKNAAFPLDFVQSNKFWPSIRRVDDAYGDRNLVCTCVPIEVYAE